MPGTSPLRDTPLLGPYSRLVPPSRDTTLQKGLQEDVFEKEECVASEDDYWLLNLLKWFRRYSLTHAISRTMSSPCPSSVLVPGMLPEDEDE